MGGGGGRREWGEGEGGEIDIPSKIMIMLKIVSYIGQFHLPKKMNKYECLLHSMCGERQKVSLLY